MRELLSQLGQTEERHATLEGIKPALSSLSRKEAEDGLKDVDLSPVFDCLSTNDPNVVKTASDILQHLLNLSDPALVLDRYGCLMVEGLTSEAEDSVVLLVLRQLRRCATDDDLVSLVSTRGLVTPIIRKLRAELAVSSEVTSLLVSMADTRPGLEIITGAESVKLMSELAEVSSILQMRVLEVMVLITQLSGDHLKAVERTGFLAQLVSLLQTQDFLVQLNVTELLTQLAITSHGHKYLETTGVMETMGVMLRDCPNLPFADVIMPGLVKFWGNVAHLKPRDILTRYPCLVSALVNMVQSEDSSVKIVAFETIGYIGVSLEGKTALRELGNIMLDWLDKLGHGMGNKVFKNSALTTLTHLIRLEPENQSEEMVSLTRSWFTRLPHGTDMLAQDIKLPFVPLKVDAYHLLQALSGQLWGRRLVMTEPGLCEYLLNRDNEAAPEAREERWRLLGQLVNSRETKEMLGPELDLEMRQYVRDGAHYVPTVTQVAYEEQQ